MTNLAERVVQFPKSTANLTSTAHLTSGANEAELDVENGAVTVDIARRRLAEILNLSEDHKALLNGHDVPGNQFIRPGDNVEFVRQAGVKG